MLRGKRVNISRYDLVVAKPSDVAGLPSSPTFGQFLESSLNCDRKSSRQGSTFRAVKETIAFCLRCVLPRRFLNVTFPLPNGFPLVIHLSICVPKTLRSMNLIHSNLCPAICPTESESENSSFKTSQSSKSLTPTKLLFHWNGPLHQAFVVVGSRRRGIKKNNGF